MTFKVVTHRFTGPLDLLLSLIENKKLPIEEVVISEITDEYLRYMQEAELPPMELADYIVIFARLLYLKSHRMLKLPIEEPLFDQLNRFIFVKEARKNLKEKYENRRPFYSLAGRVIPSFSQPKFSLDDLNGLLYKFLVEETPIIAELKLQETIKIEEAISLLNQMVIDSEGIDLQAISSEKSVILVYFLAMLALLKRGMIMVEQKQMFGKIYIRRATEQLTTDNQINNKQQTIDNPALLNEH